MNNSILAEKFGQGATEGQANNMFIEGETIYSYGHHFKIATRLTPDQKFATGVDFVYNSERYGSATDKHQSHVRSNLSSFIAIPDCNLEESVLRDYVKELRIEVNEVKAKQDKLKTKGVRFQQFENKIAEMTERVNEVNNFTVALYGGQAVHFIKEPF